MQRRRQHNNGDLNNIDVLPPPGSGTEEEGRNWQWTSLSQAMCGRQSGDAAGSGSPDSTTLHVQHGHPRRRTAHMALALRVLDCALLRRVLSVATNLFGTVSSDVCQHLMEVPRAQPIFSSSRRDGAATAHFVLPFCSIQLRQQNLFENCGEKSPKITHTE